MAKKVKNDLVQKDVKLVGRDFGQFRKNLIDFSKNYFPNIFNDFNESSPGMMFMEMASYVGDVLSFYTDTQLRESLLTNAEEKTNLFNLAAAYGYKPKNVVPATVNLDVYQLLPAKGSGDSVRPDYDYALTISEGMQVGSSENNTTNFITTTQIDFSTSSSFDLTEISVYSVDENTNEPIYYLLKKKVKASSGRVETTTFTFNEPKIYDKIKLTNSNIIRIRRITDSDGDVWTEVPYLAQDTVFEQIENNEDGSQYYNAYSGETPYLLELKRVPKRFITRFEDEQTMVIQFGAGISANADEEIIPNPDNVGSALYNIVGDLDQGIDPSNFLYTKTYGVAPSNTTLTVEYLVGNGVTDNVSAKDLTNITSVITSLKNEINLDNTVINFVKKSVAVTNQEPAVGGRSNESMDEIRNNAMAYFAAQNRTVTREDYVMRCYALPPQFGSIAKAYLVQDYQIENKKSDNTMVSSEIPNPLALNLYTLGYDSNKKLKVLNPATKNNLKNYISYYRLLTDAVNIKDAHIINIGLDFEILVLPNYNSNEVLLRCIDALKEYFNIDNWRINEPIQLSKLYVLLDGVDGVQSVIRPDKDGVGGLQIHNKFNGNYSPNKYSIKNATKYGVIYPAKDPSIFEIKFPNSDIRGKVVTQSF
jgi:phage-related baseplate assembly protein